jgi:hypothetical protein
MRTLEQLEIELKSYQNWYKDSFDKMDFHYCAIIKERMKTLTARIESAYIEDALVLLLDDLVAKNMKK